MCRYLKNVGTLFFFASKIKWQPQPYIECATSCKAAVLSDDDARGPVHAEFLNAISILWLIKRSAMRQTVKTKTKNKNKKKTSKVTKALELQLLKKECPIERLAHYFHPAL